jgi:F-type H+-transporting ATPase subunit gamma
MAVSTRLIKRRIRSISNTRKITRAMELVAAAKMRKSVHFAVSSREYSKTAQSIVDDVRKLVDPKTHPLLAGRREAKSSLVIVVGSNRGLCGGFNYQVLKKFFEFIKTRPEHRLDIVTVGRRAEIAVRKSGQNIVASFESMADAPSFERSRPVGSYAYKQFMDGTVDRVFLAYTDFKSAVVQVPTIRQVLPIIPEQELKDVQASSEEQEKPASEETQLFEPGPRQILDHLLPRLLETELYQAFLESSASEHSARMMAMRNATDNASDMMEDLTFTFNQARQANITREISEISAGKASLE